MALRQGSPRVFSGDMAFSYSKWEYRERVGTSNAIDASYIKYIKINTNMHHMESPKRQPPKFRETRFQAMQDHKGHFPVTENPKRFAEYLLPILDELRS